MVSRSESTAVAPRLANFADVAKNWGWFLGLGILFVALGTAGLVMTFGLTLASVLLFGVLLLVGGLMQLLEATKTKGWKSMLWHVLTAVLYVFAGVTVVMNPLAASLLFTALLAGAIIAIGVFRIIVAIQLRGAKGWAWPLFGGAISILLGAMILVRWPLSGLWAIGLFVAVDMLVHGWSYVFIALAAKHTKRQIESASGPQPQAA